MKFFSRAAIGITFAAAGLLILLATHGEFLYAASPDGPPRNETPAGVHTDYYERKTHALEGGHALTYFWIAPSPPYPEGVKFPLVLALHGAAGWVHAGYYLAPARMRLEYPAFIVIPVLPAGQRWADPGELTGSSGLQEAVSLINDIRKKYPVDGNRIYAIGCSDGGTGAYAAARYFPDVFAAAVPISGAWSPADAANMTRTPLWAFHGTRDRVIYPKYSRKTIQGIRNFGGAAYLTELDLAHECDSPQFYSGEMWSWLFSQSLKGRSSQKAASNP